jgi:hypothetical protein
VAYVQAQLIAENRRHALALVVAPGFLLDDRGRMTVSSHELIGRSLRCVNRSSSSV